MRRFLSKYLELCSSWQSTEHYNNFVHDWLARWLSGIHLSVDAQQC